MARIRVSRDGDWDRFTHSLIETHLPRVEWSEDAVVDAIVSCRLIDKGVPMFRTGYAGDFEIDGKPAVMFICWAGKNTDAGRSVMFVNVPEDVFEELKNRTGDWRWLMERYAPSLLSSLEEASVVL